MSLNIIKNIFFICIINYFVLLIPNNNVPELNDLKLISIDTLLKINPHVLYQKCHDPVSFNLYLLILLLINGLLELYNDMG